MAFANPLSLFPIGQFFESLLPDFILAFMFFTALVYAVLAKRFDHRRSAVAMAAAIGLALAMGLVWWEFQSGLSVKNLGPLAVGLAVILLGMIMFQAIRQTGGSWAGAGIAMGASILIAWILGADWPVAPAVVQSLAIVGLLVGIVAYFLHRHVPSSGYHWTPANVQPELAGIRHDMSDLYEDRRADQRIGGALAHLRARTDSLSVHHEEAPDFMAQLRQILPAEGWLTERLAALRARAHVVRKGHLDRIDELRHVVGKLPRDVRKKAEEELAARYDELHMDKRLERLDAAVAENERHIRDLTREAETAVTHNDYKKLAALLDAARKLQAHNGRLFALIERGEHKLIEAAQRVAKDISAVKDA